MSGKDERRVGRRAFLGGGAVVAVTVAVPPWVWGCGASSGRPPVRAAGGGEPRAPAASPPSAATPETSAGVTEDQRARVARFERDAVFTAAAPGPWEGKAGSHVPQVTFEAGEGTVQLFTAHGMSPEHYITAQYVKDQDGHLFAFAAHEGTDSEARAGFSLPAGTTRITAYSHCNQHGDWSAEPAGAT